MSLDITFEKPEDIPENLRLGWLSPTGIFTPSQWGDHEEVAISILSAKNWKFDWMTDSLHAGHIISAADWLTCKKHYILFHDPGMSKTIHLELPVHTTKAQEEFLYGYSMKFHQTFHKTYHNMNVCD